MSQFSQRSSARLLESVHSVFQTGEIFEKKDRHIIFVCGGPSAGGSLRFEFLTWIKGKLPALIPLVAEKAYLDASGRAPRLINISDFERLIADIADCVLIFPESPGSFAELGFFCKTDSKIRNKILVANTLKYFSDDSFINNGPIEFIDHHRSIFSPKIPVSTGTSGTDFTTVVERIMVRLKPIKNRKKFLYKPYKEMKYGEKFTATLAILMLLRAVTLSGIEFSVRRVFGSASRHEISHILSIFQAIGLTHCRSGYFVPTHEAETFLDYGQVSPFKSLDHLHATVAYYHQRYDKAAFAQLAVIA